MTKMKAKRSGPKKKEQEIFNTGVITGRALELGLIGGMVGVNRLSFGEFVNLLPFVTDNSITSSAASKLHVSFLAGYDRGTSMLANAGLMQVMAIRQPREMS